MGSLQGLWKSLRSHTPVEKRFCTFLNKSAFAWLTGITTSFVEGFGNASVTPRGNLACFLQGKMQTDYLYMRRPGKPVKSSLLKSEYLVSRKYQKKQGSTLLERTVLSRANILDAAKKPEPPQRAQQCMAKDGCTVACSKDGQQRSAFCSERRK